MTRLRWAGLLLGVAVPALAVAIYYDWSAWRAVGELGFPYDDAWIHAQFARNLASGQGFSYAGGRPVAGSTAPLWTVFVAVGYGITHSAIVGTKGLGILLQVASGVVAARLAMLLTGSGAAALTAGLMVVLTPVMAWGGVGGMEVPLAVFLVLAGFDLYFRGDRARVAGIATLFLSCLARPENLIVGLIAAGHYVLTGGSARAITLRAVTATLIGVLVLGPVVAFDYATFGRPLPTTFYAKSGPGIIRALSEGDMQLATRALTTHGPAAIAGFARTLFDQFWWTALAVPVGLAACMASSLRRRGAWLLAIILIAAPFAMGATAPQRLKPDNVRYAGQLVCLAAVVGTIGVWWLVANRASQAVVTFLVPVLVAGPLVRAYQQAPLYALSVKNIQQLHVAMGRWACETLPQGSTIAVNDIGALAFFSRHYIIDLEGLVTPEALNYRGVGRGLRFANDAKPDYVIVFPSWHPDFMQAPDRFEEIYRVQIPDNFIAGDNTLVAYRTPWTRLPPIRKPVSATRACRGFA